MSLTLLEWVGMYGIESLFWWWILAWGGAEWVEGWKSFFLIHWLAPTWSSEGIRLFALVVWVLSTLWFVFGLFMPEVRMLLI